MLLQIALFLSMIIQLGAATISISLIRRTRFNVSWILISAGFVLMALRRLFEVSLLFWDIHLVSKEEVNSWIGILISVLMMVGVIFIRQIFNLQDRIDEIQKENETKVLKAVIQTEEKSRQAFARELHDGLGPVLSSIKMTTSAIEMEKMDHPNRIIFERTCNATDEAINTLKEIANHLSPHLLKNYGLVKALDNFTQRLLVNSSIHLVLNNTIGIKRFGYDVEINVYRIICELLNNSVKHGKPDKIQIDIRGNDNILFVEYEDDGNGFDSKIIPHTGMGLENLNSRIKSLHGSINIDSRPGNGMKVKIQIPLR
ncbi:sensor histidine kinase [uncultured Draconibacterium sp.]|uniref:sensor histidine kinase n=1 Tax=uncultured Draconibacterium sp. TaxID=1573823 RepID=UPI002AA65A85|nr:sensor histidine kinase [uncultured Draconibacterium sp.]